MRKICVVTGSRAEYGLMKRLMRLIADDSELKLQIVATNMHLSPEFGLTYKEIEADGFKIDKKVQMLLSSDTANAVVKSIGLAMIGFADAYEDLQPDLLLVLGDRYEILSAVSAALIYQIPVAHLHGGEITEGAYDDEIRHSITKMSHLHFTSTEEYQKRVIQLGENPKNVFNVGAIGIDNIKNTKFLSKEEIENSINFKLDKNTILVTYHPVTLENESAEIQIKNLLSALGNLKHLRIIFTKPNSDTDGRIIIKLIDEFVENNKERTCCFTSLGALRYLSVLQYIGAVVGNSSSGILEVPSFHIPTVNIGNRQKGRIAAKSIINCGIEVEEITKNIDFALNSKGLDYSNPYEKKDTAIEIYNIIKKTNFSNLVIKSFYNL